MQEQVLLSNIQNNTIRNIDWSNSLNGTWTGIYIGRGDVNVGTITGNTIGADNWYRVNIS